jgi:hypothetical protein
MSKIKIQGNASGTGVVTLTAPATSTDKTITLPDSTDTLIGAVTTDALTTRINATGGRKNLIINGDFKISQRGVYTSASSIVDGTYYLDRWELDIAAVTGTVQNVSNGYLGKLNTQKMVASSTATGRLVSIQKIEVSGGMLGVVLTASAQVKSNSTNARLFLVDNTNGTVLDVVAHTGGGTFEKLAISGTAPTNCTDLRVYLALRSSAQANVAINSGDYVEFTQVQLELGSTATDFEHRSYGEELALCQRYYQRVGTSSTDYNMNMTGSYASGTALSYNVVKFPTTMRVPPTVSIFNTSTYRFNTPSFSSSSIHGFRIDAVSNSTGLGYYRYNYTADAEL